MRLIKFIRFWWEYNSNSINPSTLFQIVVIISIPFILLMAFAIFSDGETKKNKKNSKAFWNAWNKIKDGE